MRRAAALIGFCMLAGSPAHAVEATTEEAQRLVGEFHRYVGTPRAGQADHVRVVPEGEAYRVTIDFDQLASPLQSLGFTLDSAELSFLTRPQGDATWRVTDLSLTSPLTIRMASQTLTYRWEGIQFEGTYDPALASFTKFAQTIASTSSEVRGADGTSTSRIGEQVVEGTTTAVGDGTVNSEFAQTMSNLVAEETITLPASDPKEPAPLPLEFAYSIESGAFDISLEGFDMPGLLKLWAYAVERAQEDSPSIDQQVLKTMLGELLPLFTELDEGLALAGLNVVTPLGDFGMESIDFRITLPGLLAESGLAMSIAASGPTYPAETMPAWAKDLAPTEIALGFEVSGFDLDAPARHLLAAYDADRDPPLQDSDLANAAMLTLPADGATLAVPPSRFDGPILDVAFEGAMTLSLPTPTGTFNVTASGVTEAIAALNGAADPMASQALAFLSAVQLFGSAKEDGSMEFVVVMKDDGSITVNDQVVKPPAGDPT